MEQYSDKELRDELERRKKTRVMKPAMLDNFDVNDLKQLCLNYIEDLDKQGWADEDHKDYIFEAALEMFYGKTVWTFINSKG